MDRAILTPQGVELIGKNNKTIRIVFMYKGMRCRETMKLEPSKANIKYCANLRAEILNKIARNEFNYGDYFPESKLATRIGLVKQDNNVLCEELLNKQLQNYEMMVKNGYMSPSTLFGYRKIITGQLLPFFAKYTISAITVPIIKEWISSLNATPKTIRNCLTPLHTIFKDAVVDGLIKENPIAKLDINKFIQIASVKSEFDAEPFNDDEKQEIIGAATGQIKNLFQFGFWSGLRTSELIALKWADIDFKRGIANISRAKVCNVEKGTKTKSGVRDLILLPKALDALKNQLSYTKDSDYVFHNPNTSQAWANSNKVSDAWRKLLATTKVRYRNCYQMRHTFASTLLSNGENAWWVATQMGHVDVEMIFKHYGRWIPKKDDNGYKFVGKY